MYRRALPSLLLVLVFAGCRIDQPEPVWFVHATDPHLFYGEDGKKKWDPAQKKRNEELNQKAFSDLFRALRDLPGTDAKPAFLLITGDFGIDRFLTNIKSAESLEAQKKIAAILSASPVPDIYFVPGNNDVANESASPDAYDDTQAFFKGVKDQAQGPVTLRDLTYCYFNPTASCEADIQGTSFRFIGFPSHSFKNEGTGSFAANRAAQEGQADRLKALVEQAENADRNVLVVSHIPELDDPKTQADERFAGKAPSPAGATTRPRWSAWNVSSKVFQTWKDVVDSDAVAGVLAGHFHDSHREIYYWPWRWSPVSGDRADPHKVFLAPPLAVRYQDTSPRQARGFVLVGLQGDRVTRRFYWYHPGRGIFRPDPVPVRRTGWRWPALSNGVAWLWQLGSWGEDRSELPRATVFAIALLAAFLTAVQVWQIPPPDRSLSHSPGKTETGETPPTSAKEAQERLALSFFGNNFSRTVLGGLVGMLAISLVDAFWKDEAFWGGKGMGPQAYYLVLFVVFFLTLLALSSLLRGIGEALRSRVLIYRPASGWPPPPPWEVPPAKSQVQAVEPPKKDGRSAPNPPPGRSHNVRRWVGYWLHRLAHWLSSFRTTLLVLGDTVFHFLQGQNQMQTEVFEQDIVKMHWSMIWVADRIRKEIDRAVVAALRRQSLEPPDEAAVRVGISLLSADEQRVYYVARERGALGKTFERRSVAWVCVFTGQCRWYKDPLYANAGDTELYDNRTHSIADEPGPLKLGTFFEQRDSSDYKGFIVFPFPPAHRGKDLDHRRGGIHLSFKEAGYMDALWQGLETVENQPNYPDAGDLLRLDETLMPPASPPQPAGNQLRILDPELRAVLHESLEVLGELFTYFSDSVFEDYIRPRLRY